MKKNLLKKSKIFRKYMKRTEPIYYTNKDILFFKLSILFLVLGTLSLLTTIVMFFVGISIHWFFIGSMLLFLISGFCYSFPIFETIYLIIKK